MNFIPFEVRFLGALLLRDSILLTIQMSEDLFECHEFILGFRYFDTSDDNEYVSNVGISSVKTCLQNFHK